jgi:hypothetical protein
MKVSKSARGIPGLLSLVMLAACGPPSIDKEIIQGSYDGFTIGDSASTVYQRLREKALSRELPANADCYLAGPDSTVLDRMEPHVRVWKRWVVLAYGSGGVDSVRVDFRADTVAEATMPLLSGQGYDSAWARLRARVRANGYDSLDFRLTRKDLEKPLAACMADTAFRPVYGPWKIWSIRYRSSCDLDDLQLFLKNGVLDVILRTRYCNLGL